MNSLSKKEYLSPKRQLKMLPSAIKSGFYLLWMRSDIKMSSSPCTYFNGFIPYARIPVLTSP